jgi:amidohydrolase
MKKTLLSLGLCGVLTAQAQVSDKIYQQVAAASDQIEAKTIAWRHDFHQHPELGNREIRTSAIVAKHLRALGLEVKENVAKTGVVAILKGAQPGPCIGLRADMDALPVSERNQLPYKSQAKGLYNGAEVDVMHACGHDMHTAILMSVAEILAGMKSQLKGTVKFVFQPAEEGPPAGEEGGADLMVKEGVLENPKVDVMFGLHINSATEVGTIRLRGGGIMAASDWLSITVKGKGSHGSQPWMSVDPVIVSAQIIQGLQNIISRQTELTKYPAVISVTTIHAGLRQNIIPETAEMKGTIRTLDKAMQQDIWDKIKRTATQIAEASGATADVVIENKAKVTYNDPALVKKMMPSFQRAAGIDRVLETEAVTGAEDFSCYADKVPAVFFFLGGMKKGLDPKKAYPHHTADFVVEDEGMKLGVKTFCHLVFDYMYAK